MIPNASRVSVLEGGTITDEDFEMGIDLQSLPFLQEQLSNLYSERELAVLREYSTNARDEHVRLGIKRPIEVTLPTNWNPKLTIRDFGEGLDADDLENVYSKYGASTKRSSNDVAGMLGFGSKAALAVAGVFEVISIKDGIKRIVAVRRNERGIGQMTTVSKEPSSEPSGVTIVVPVSNAAEYRKQANYLFGFWEPGTVIVDGRQPTQHPLEKVADGFYHIPLSANVGGGSQDIIVMGNVPYRVSGDRRIFDWRDTYYNRRKNVVFVEMGAVEFPPSREEIQWTPKTKETFERIRRQYNDFVKAEITKEISQAASHAAAWKAKEKWERLVQSQAIPTHYKGDKFPHQTHVSLPHRAWSISDNYDTTANRDSYLRYSYLADVKNVIIVGKKLDGGITQVQKKKVRKYVDDNKIDASRAVFVESWDDNLCKWVNAMTRRVKWDDIKNLVVTKPQAGNRASVGTYPQRTKGDYDWRIKAIDDTKPVYYVMSDDCDTSNYRPGFPHKAFLQMVEQDAVLVKMAANRKDKFLRDYPKAKYVFDHAKAEYQRLEKALTPTERARITASYEDRALADVLDPTKIDDPALATMVLAVKQGTINAKYMAAKNFVDSTSRLRNVITVQEASDSPWLEKYPLLTVVDRYGRMGSKTKEHLYFYLNSHFQENK